jgi:hypothetical protein
VQAISIDSFPATKLIKEQIWSFQETLLKNELGKEKQRKDRALF